MTCHLPIQGTGHSGGSWRSQVSHFQLICSPTVTWGITDKGPLLCREWGPFTACAQVLGGRSQGRRGGVDGVLGAGRKRDMGVGEAVCLAGSARGLSVLADSRPGSEATFLGRLPTWLVPRP